MRLPDGLLLCADCALTERGHVDRGNDEPDVPITMPNTNMPMTH